ncbi:Uncharacterised protein [Pseudomonas aeruginosa]|nr:Uncharacterised protein [Pseudomonas aeruginosa]
MTIRSQSRRPRLAEDHLHRVAGAQLGLYLQRLSGEQRASLVEHLPGFLALVRGGRVVEQRRPSRQGVAGIHRAQ